MLVSDYLKTASSTLRVNKLRSFLTMLGIIIGVAAVISVVSLGEGTKAAIVSQFSSLGSNNIFIEPGPPPKNFQGKNEMMESLMNLMQKTLKAEDAEAIEKLPEVEEVAPITMNTTEVSYLGESDKYTILGTNSKAIDIVGATIKSGSFFSENDVLSRSRVAVIGSKVSEHLFNGENAVGQKIRINNINFKVIGVINETGVQGFLNLDEAIYIPLTTAQKIVFGKDYLQWIIAKVKDSNMVDAAVSDIRILMRERHHINNPEGDTSKDDFRVVSQKETLKKLESITSLFTYFLSIIASISLLVGGIGIMNIMLVSVTERTREFGLRKAVGAKNKEVLYQVLLESIYMTMLGGIIGIIIGISFSFVGGKFMASSLGIVWQFAIPVLAILVGFVTAVIVGLVFGLYPAKKAEELSPIEALRYE